jgi:hypothetical protein
MKDVDIPLTGYPLSKAYRKRYEYFRGLYHYSIIKGKYYHGWVGQVIRLAALSDARGKAELLKEYGSLLDPRLHHHFK